MSNNRKGYEFSTNQRKERKAGTELKCEMCGKKDKHMQGHHLIPIFLSRKNPVLLKRIVTDLANLQMLCTGCHKKADAEHQHWDAHEIGIIAWALFDLDPKEVEEAQGTAKITRKANRSKNRRKNHRRSGGKRR